MPYTPIVDCEKQIYAYEEMAGDLALLGRRHAGRLDIEVIGRSLDNRDIHVARYGNPKASQHVLIQSGMHGREYMTTLLAMKLLEHYLGLFPDGIGDVMIHVVPASNPDGIAISQFGLDAVTDGGLRARVMEIARAEAGEDSAKPEYFLCWKANARGVDINRNFPQGWDELSMRVPASSRYRGPAPLSEPESRALADYLARWPFAATISYHTTGSFMYWMGNVDERLRGINYSLACAVSDCTGYYPVNDELDTVEQGGFKDWTLTKLGIPSLTIEVGVLPSPVPIEEFAAIIERNLVSWAQIARWVEARAKE